MCKARQISLFLIKKQECFHIKLILVDNGSEDNSKEICLKYKQQYQKNINFIQLESNVGPGGARNAGLRYVKGKYP